MNTANEQDSNLNGDFQNSNLTNFSSKKFARDYDKEPIVIKNKTNFYIAFLGIICLAFMIAMYIYEPTETRYRQLFIIFPIFGLPVLIEYIFDSFNKKFIAFYNDKIVYYTNKKPKKTIFLNEIKSIKLAYFARDNEWLRKQGAIYRFLLKFDPYFTMICFGLIFMLIAANLAIEYAQTAGFFTTIFATALAFLIIFVSKFIYFLIFKFQLRFMFYDNAIIKYKDKEAIFTMENTNEYRKIKEFFIRKRGVNLDGAERHVWLSYG